jgi:hypothetical protein
MSGIDTYTKLLLHCDGADGSQTFIDSATGKAVTAVNHAQIDTAQSKFGGGALLLDGTDDYLTALDSADWNFGDGDFTIDFWFRPAAGQSAYTTWIAQEKDSSNYWLFDMGANGTNPRFSSITGTVQKGEISVTNAQTFTTNTWYHMALVRYGANLLIFKDGTSLALTVSNALGTQGDHAAVLTIGMRPSIGRYTNGWIDEFRISKGIARWTANFTPPTSPYSKSGTGFSGVSNPWVFMKDVWENHNKLWTPKKKLILPKDLSFQI